VCYQPPLGDESVHVQQLVRRLRGAGREVRVVNCEVGAVASPEYRRVSGSLELTLVLLDMLAPDCVLHVHTNGHSARSWALVWLGAASALARRSAAIISIHSGVAPDYLRTLSMAGRWIVRAALKPFARIVCVSEEIAAALSHLGIAPGRLAVIPTHFGSGDPVAALIAIYDDASATSDPRCATSRGITAISTAVTAARTLSRECVGFRTTYAVRILPDAGLRTSLQYHIHSDPLFIDELEADADGVPMVRYRLLGRHYNPVFIAWWGLLNLNRFANTGDVAERQRFLTQVDWLKRRAVTRGDGAVVWPCDFDWQEGRARLQAPWISAMYQGMVMSALVRAHRLTGDASVLELCRGAADVFEQDVAGGGVRTIEDGYVLYEEYPAYPLPRILDGFLFSLLGLYDVWVETGETRFETLFRQGVAGLLFALPRWDYRGKWSWYGTHGALCPPHYHTLNRILLEVLGRIASEPALLRQAEQWRPDRLTWRDRAEIYSVFVVTKNWARVRLPNQAGRRGLSCAASAAS
jgi:heparosan-N-sulfate-glucuronate 5-epimerase